MLGLFNGRTGARAWRRALSEGREPGKSVARAHRGRAEGDSMRNVNRYSIARLHAGIARGLNDQAPCLVMRTMTQAVGEQACERRYAAGICHFRGRWLDAWHALIQERR
jgi:hypothetical protein